MSNDNQNHSVHSPAITCPTPALKVNGFCPGSFVLKQVTQHLKH